MMTKMALVDFCGTVVDFQTLMPYLERMLKEHNRLLYCLCCNPVNKWAYWFLSRVIWHLFGIEISDKRMLVGLLKGISEEDFIRYGREYYVQRVRPHLIPEAMELLQKLKREGCILTIVSGGSAFYISCFAEEFGIAHSLTAELGFENGVCTGKVLRECLREEKPVAVRQFVRENGLDCEFAAGITDHESDLPMLEMCAQKFVISAGGHQPWVTDEMKEIIYQIKAKAVWQ